MLTDREPHSTGEVGRLSAGWLVSLNVTGDPDPPATAWRSGRTGPPSPSVQRRAHPSWPGRYLAPPVPDAGVADGDLHEFLATRRRPWDVVITVCDQAHEACPFFPGAKRRRHGSLPDPSQATGTEEGASTRSCEIKCSRVTVTQSSTDAICS